MNLFEKSMLKEGVSLATINAVKNSPVWIKRIRSYNSLELDIFIQVFPKMYQTQLIDEFYSHPKEFEQASKQYVPMDLD